MTDHEKHVLPPPSGHRYGERMTTGSRLLYRVTQGVVWTIGSTVFRIRVHGLERVPKRVAKI